MPDDPPVMNPPGYAPVKKNRLAPACAGVAAAVLLVAVAAQLLAPDPAKIGPTSANLAELLPADTHGWRAQDLPIAETESLKIAVREMLNFSGAVQKRYQSGGREFTVYVAYWAPARMHPRQIAGHTPDVCWVAAGWRMTGEDYALETRFRDRPLWHAQRRTFTQGGQIRHVLYWHLAGGRLSGFSESPRSRTSEFLDTIRFNPFAVPREQYFIRLSSPEPLEQLWSDPGFGDVMSRLVPLGLVARP